MFYSDTGKTASLPQRVKEEVMIKNNEKVYKTMHICISNKQNQ